MRITHYEVRYRENHENLLYFTTRDLATAYQLLAELINNDPLADKYWIDQVTTETIYLEERK